MFQFSSTAYFTKDWSYSFRNSYSSCILNITCSCSLALFDPMYAPIGVFLQRSGVISDTLVTVRRVLSPAIIMSLQLLACNFALYATWAGLLFIKLKKSTWKSCRALLGCRLSQNHVRETFIIGPKSCFFRFMPIMAFFAKSRRKQSGLIRAYFGNSVQRSLAPFRKKKMLNKWS